MARAVSTGRAARAPRRFQTPERQVGSSQSTLAATCAARALMPPDLGWEKLRRHSSGICPSVPHLWPAGGDSLRQWLTLRWRGSGRLNTFERLVDQTRHPGRVYRVRTPPARMGLMKRLSGITSGSNHSVQENGTSISANC